MGGGAPGGRGLRSLDLFAGAGGLALGAHLAGLRHVALIEWNAAACATLRANAAARALPDIDHWPVVRADARAVRFTEFGPVDVVIGGPPCQPFSIGGKARGQADERDLIPCFARAVGELLPRAFIMENVRGLARPAFAGYLERVLLQLSYPTVTPRPDEGWSDHPRRLAAVRAGHDAPRYRVAWRVLDAADYGVPQRRWRVFIVGMREDVAGEWRFPPPTHGRGALRHEQWTTGAYWARHGLPRPARPPGLPPPRAEELRRRPWRTLRDAIGDLPPPLEEADWPGVLDHRARPGARVYAGHTGSPLDAPAKALKAGDHGVPGGENTIAYPDGTVRYLTVREAARVQTFPDSWRLAGAWSEAMRQVGNAVPVELARAVVASVAAALDRDAAPGGSSIPPRASTGMTR